MTATDGRRFGVTVGLAFLAFASVAWWRDHPTTMRALAALGGTLVAAGLVVPARLGPVERAWMSFAHLISRVTTPIVMGAMYLLVLTPIGALRRTLGRNPLVPLEHEGGFWVRRPEGARRSKSMRRQF